MPREITDGEGITWTCVQAFAGLGNDPEKAKAARVEGSGDKVRVVCTPSGATRSVRIELPSDWETSMQEHLLSARRVIIARISPCAAFWIPPGPGFPARVVRRRVEALWRRATSPSNVQPSAVRRAMSCDVRPACASRSAA
jgi:hypothetical protein